jgi:hypothetical protein
MDVLEAELKVRIRAQYLNFELNRGDCETNTRCLDLGPK